MICRTRSNVDNFLAGTKHIEFTYLPNWKKVLMKEMTAFETCDTIPR